MTIKDDSIEVCLNENDAETEQCRINLLNDPNYGIVLCFLDKFRFALDLPNYPLQYFEDDLVNYHEQIPSRLIDFHFTLLKRLSLAKNAQRDKFDSVITKFTSRFDANDSEHLTANGYLLADIHVKIRIIKNLLESQFDVNKTLQNLLINKSTDEIKSSPLGRDRFGVSYWIYMDNDCFVRLFREDADIDRTWTNVAQNRNELERFIKLLMTDAVVRKRFPNWTIDYNLFTTLPPSDEFEVHYSPIPINIEEEIETTVDEISDGPIERKHGQSESSTEPSNSKTSIRRGRKRKLANEETSIDDSSFSLRRSSRLRKVLTMESASIVSSKTISQSSNAKKKRPSRRQRNTDDWKYCSTSSSDEHCHYSSDDEYDFDTYFSNQSQIDTDDNSFEPEEEEDSEQIHPAKTAQLLTKATTCYVCSKSDRPDVLLLCDGCDDAYHLECLRSILLSVPNGDWFCPLCEHKKLTDCLIGKLKELLINFNISETKRMEHASKKSLQQKIKIKEYSSDESTLTSELEQYDGEESILSTSQFNFELPKRISRLLHRRHRSSIKNHQQIKSLTTRLCDTSLDLNEKLGSPLIYVNSDETSYQIKSMITSSKQTSSIVRRWNDVQRRSRLKATDMKTLDETTTSNCADENSSSCPDDVSSSYNESTALLPIDICSSRNIVKKADTNFDRLTRDIQFAVSEANLLPMTTTTMTIKSTDQQHVKRIQKTKFSPYMIKAPSKSPSSKLPIDAHKIFQSTNYSVSASSTTNVSNIDLTPSLLSFLLDATND